MNEKEKKEVEESIELLKKPTKQGEVGVDVLVNPVVCSYCGEELHGEELESPYKDESGDIMCDNCYTDHYEDYCDLCDNIVENTELESKPGELIAVWREAPGLCCTIAPGYYRVKQWPIFYAAGMIGGYIFPDAIEKVIDLDDEGRKTAEEYDKLCGKLCGTCRNRIEALLGNARVERPRRLRLQKLQKEEK